MSHFYEKTESGIEPRHYVEMTTRPGELRPTRITDVRKWHKGGRVVVPSVTTVMNILDKPALLNWKVDQHLLQAHKLVREENYFIPHNELDFFKDVKNLTEQEMSKAPSAGTDVHKVLEDYISGKGTAKGFEIHCANIEESLGQHCGALDWGCEKHFIDARHGFGGCVDLFSHAPDLTYARPWVIDYKTKQTADKFKPGKMAYPDHSRQLAAYREGLGLPKARCANVFICIENGEVDFHEHSEADLIKGWKVFEHALAIWKLENLEQK